MVGGKVWTPVGQKFLRFKIVDTGLTTFPTRQFFLTEFNLIFTM